MLLPGAEEPSAEPAAGLTAKGWTVRPVAVYRTLPQPLPQEIVERWRAGAIDAFVVTAGSTARAAVAAAGLPGPSVIALGASAAAVATDLGLTVTQVAERPDAAAVAAAAVAALG